MEIILIKISQLLASLSILVIVHEYGHFLFAQIFKVKVEKFYLFFNPWFSLLKYKSKKTGTEYGIGWLPLGGYAKIAGMIDESLDLEALKKSSHPWEFRAKPAWNRLLITTGGVLMNFILTFIIYSMIVFKWGDNYIPIDKTPLFFSKVAHQVGFQDGDIILKSDNKVLTRYDDLDLFRIIDARSVIVFRRGVKKKIVLPKNFRLQFIDAQTPFSDYQSSRIDSLLTGSNASKIGLQIGDKIVSINGKETNLFSELALQLSKYKDTDVQLDVVRSSKKLKLRVHVGTNGKIGFVSKAKISPIINNRCFLQAFPAGFALGIRKLSFYVLQLKLVFSKTGIENIGGFGTIGKLFPAAWNWLTFWNITAFLSIILGVMNLLPIPALDGGHIIFLLYEIVTGDQPNKKFMEYAQIIGMILLFALLIYANGMDIFRVFFKKR